MKRIICFILALLLLCPTAFAAKDLTFAFSDVQGEPGDTVTIIASSKGAPVACSYKLVLVYDTKVLKPVEVKNIKSEGFFMSNLEATYEGKAAVNALSAAATKAFEGDCDLFSVSFEIIGEPEGGKSVIEIPYYECYDADIKMLDAAFEECAVKVGKEPAGGNDDQQGNTGGEDQGNTGEQPDQPDDETTGNENTGNENTGDESTGNESTGNDTAGNESTGETGKTEEGASPEKEDKTPTGKWEIFEQTEEITHSENGDINVYKGEFIRDEEDKLTDIKLYDEEGKPAGSLKVEEKEDGTIEVIEQDFSLAEDLKKPFNHFYWIIPLAVLLIAGGAAAVMILKSKKQEEENEE